MSYGMYIYVSGMVPGTTYASAPNVFESIWFWAPGWVIILLGLASLFYGIKRTVNNVLKLIILNQQRNRK